MRAVKLLIRVTEDIVDVAGVETVLYKLGELPTDVDDIVEGCNEDISEVGLILYAFLRNLKLKCF